MKTRDIILAILLVLILAFIANAVQHSLRGRTVVGYQTTGFFGQAMGPTVITPPTVTYTGPNTTSTTVTTTQTNVGTCYVGGCSGQICSDVPNAVSNCQYVESYSCYQGARCEKQATGQCGWTMTSQLSQCLANSQ